MITYKYYYFLVIFIFSIFEVNAQTFYSQIAAQYAAEGYYEKAIETEKEGMEMWERLHGKENFEYAISLENLAYFYYDMDKVQDAIRIETNALEVLEKILTKNHPSYAVMLSNLATFYLSVKNYAEASRLEEVALKIIEQQLGIDNSTYINSLKNFIICPSLLEHETPRGLNLEDEYESLVIWEKCNDFDEYKFITHDYKNEIEDELEKLKIIEENKDSNNFWFLNYALHLSQLGFYSTCLYEYEIAQKLYSQAIAIYDDFYKDKVNPDYPLYIWSQLSYIYYRLGNISNAIQIETEILAILCNSWWNREVEFTKSLISISLYYASLKDFNAAIYFRYMAKCIERKSIGVNNQAYLRSLEKLSEYYSKLDVEEAIKYQEEVIKIRSLLEPDSHVLGFDNRTLAQYYSTQNNFEKAILYETKALSIFEGIWGTSYLLPDNNQSLVNLSYYYFYDNKPDSLNSVTFSVTENKINEIKYFFTMESYTEREKTWIKDKGWFNDNLIRYNYKYDNLTLSQLGYNGLLFSKGILLNTEIEFDKFIAETGDKSLLEKYNEVKSLRRQLNKLYEKPIGVQGCDTDSLEKVAIRFERELMNECTEFGDYTRNLSITWEEVQKGLKKKDVAIEFVSFDLNQDSTMYMAYVLKPDMEAPEMVRLFEEKDITSLCPPSKPENIYSIKRTHARELVWDKLQPYLEGCENVYFAPDGVLHQIAIEYLPDSEDEGTMADKYNMHRLSSTRQIAIRHEKNNSTSAAVYGGIVYDNDVASMETESRKYPREDDLLAHRGFGPFIDYADLLDTRDGVKYLQGTKVEAEEVNLSLRGNNYQTRLVVGTEATEESFKNLSGKNNDIIHIATHGFYWKEDEADRMARANDRLMFMAQLNDDGPRYVEDKALTRSGLFMAGANNILRGDSIPEGVDDGILTAQEIAQMNLRGTDLVVLSACQTGMGDISGDGVFGLQRGFKKAGVNSLLMSLWKVDDDATQLLMTNFYRNLMSGQSKQQALLKAQKAVRENPRYNNPKYWAAFILLDALN